MPGTLVRIPRLRQSTDQATLLEAQDNELLRLGLQLKAGGYRFVTVTPETHRRINRRPENSLARSIEGVLGWSRWFRPQDGFEAVAARLHAAGCLEVRDDLARSRVRFSTLDHLIFLHSAFPTANADAVFFGPDSYRFLRAIRALLSAHPLNPGATVLDVGAGSGCGGLYAAAFMKGLPLRLLLTDINPLALRYCGVNARLNDLFDLECRQSDVLASVSGPADLILSNPPYLQDFDRRAYRHGGDNLGIDLSLRILKEALPKLAPNGRLLLYTGVPIVNGIDLFWRAAGPLVAEPRFRVAYEEIDPDVFGEELETTVYSQCDRIAVVQLTVHRAVD